MSRCKICGCDLGPGVLAVHNSPSCQPLESPCYECGYNSGKEATLECPFCHEVCCDECYDEHEAECTKQNGIWGLGSCD